MLPANAADAGLGAAGYARGSQPPNGNMPAFVTNPIKNNASRICTRAGLVRAMRATVAPTSENANECEAAETIRTAARMHPAAT